MIVLVMVGLGVVRGVIAVVEEGVAAAAVVVVVVVVAVIGK